MSSKVVVIGGGLAGLAAAAACAERGLEVELFEARRHLGGRAGSFRDPASGEPIDHCQHVAMGCCTNLLDLCRRTGLVDCFEHHRTLHFFGPDASRYDLAGSTWLPAPLHLVPGLLRLGYLSGNERLGVLRTMGRLSRGAAGRGHLDVPIGPWLARQGESARAQEQFWGIVLQSALGETLDRASLSAARKVFIDGFLAARQAYELVLPRVPLGEIYDERLARWLSERGVSIRLGSRVREVCGDRCGVHSIQLADGSLHAAPFVIAAVPWFSVYALLSPELRETLMELGALSQIQPAPITAVHLWFDRSITTLPHAVLVGRLSQWLFHRRGPEGQAEAQASGVHHQVVISASHGLLKRDRAEIVRQVRDELAAIWPAAREAQLLRWRVVTHSNAVFSVRPGLDAIRPNQRTAVANLALAGDWTCTGWPATMEGAVRSGYLATEVALEAFGKPASVLAPDLPRPLLARLLVGRAERCAP